MARRGLVCCISALIVFATGCGPTLSTYLILDAQAELDGAKTAEAEKYAIYEYTAAQEYLAKAREEQGYADFGPAIEFAGRATDMAKKARTLANEKRTNDDPTIEILEGKKRSSESDPGTEVEIVPITPEGGSE